MITKVKAYLRRRFINWLVHGLFNTIDEDDILRVVGGKLTLKGKFISEELKVKLKDDAERFKDSTIWKIIKTESQYVVNKNMFYKGQTTDDLLAGKVMLYLLQILSKKIDSLTKL